VIFALALAMFVALAFASVARAQIKGSIQVKDSESNIINGGTVYINTVAYVHGHYEDLGGNAQASGLMEVYYNDGSGLALEATLYSGTVDDEATITQTFTMSKLGTYEFRWTCQVGQPGTLGLLRCDEKTQARTTIQLVVPEPGTLAGLGMALAALGFLAVKRTRLK
jgi:hypothetical protein